MTISVKKTFVCLAVLLVATLTTVVDYRIILTTLNKQEFLAGVSVHQLCDVVRHNKGVSVEVSVSIFVGANIVDSFVSNYFSFFFGRGTKNRV